MSAQLYADRGQAVVNGIVIANLINIRYTIDESITEVDTMTDDKTLSGWKKGNQRVSGTYEFAPLDNGSMPDLSLLYGQNFNITNMLGSAGVRHTLLDVVQTSGDYGASVGSATMSIAFRARTATNEGGPGVNSILGF